MESDAASDGQRGGVITQTDQNKENEECPFNAAPRFRRCALETWTNQMATEKGKPRLTTRLLNHRLDLETNAFTVPAPASKPLPKQRSRNTGDHTGPFPSWWAVAVGPRALIVGGIESLVGADCEIALALVGPACPSADVARFVGAAIARRHLVVLAFRAEADAQRFVAAEPMAGAIRPLNEVGCDAMLDSLAWFSVKHRFAKKPVP